MASGQFTLLEMVQKVLEALGSDEVNTINDTVEAVQTARLIEDSFYELLNQREWPFLMQLIQLESLGDVLQPTTLKIPESVVRIDDVRYDWTNTIDTPLEPLNIKGVKWMEPDQFLRHVQGRNTDTAEITVFNTPNGIKIPLRVDKGVEASFWTSFDDEFIVFDGYDNINESTMQGNRSQCLAKVLPTFLLTDTYMPNVPPHFFQTWLADAKSTAFIYWRQEVSPKDEQKARRGLSVLRRNSDRTNNDDGKVKFGRRNFSFHDGHQHTHR